MSVQAIEGLGPPWLGPPQDPALAHPHGDATPVEVLEERDGVLARDPEQVLDVGGADVLALPQERDQLLLDRFQRLRVKEERLLDPYQPLALDQHLKQLVLLVAGDASAGQRFLRARRGGPGAQEIGLDL